MWRWRVGGVTVVLATGWRGPDEIDGLFLSAVFFLDLVTCFYAVQEAPCSLSSASKGNFLRTEQCLAAYSEVRVGVILGPQTVPARQ